MPVLALDGIVVSITELQAKNWRLQGVKLHYGGLINSQQTLRLSIDKLQLPPPLQELSFVDINCHVFEIKPNGLSCRQGYALVSMPGVTTSKIPFTFHFENNSGIVEISKIGLLQGEVGLKLQLRENSWQLMISGQALMLAGLNQYIDLSDYDISSGQFDLTASLSGDQQQVNQIDLKVLPQAVSIQTRDGLYAIEGLDAGIELEATNFKSRWQWQGQMNLLQGGLYVNPVYLDLNTMSNPEITLQAQGSWLPKRQQLRVAEVGFKHQGVMAMSAQGDVLQQPGSILSSAEVRFESENLDAVSRYYLQPFLEGSAASGLSLKGELQAKLQLDSQQPTEVEAKLNALQILDEQQRIALNGGNGTVFWNRDGNANQISDISWSALKVLGLPFDTAQVAMILQNKQLTLAEPVSIPLMDGHLAIEQLDYQMQGEQPDFHFKGDIQAVSLEKATSALGILPLSGTISGQIPGIRLEAGKLSLDGELLITLFDGQITVKKLAASDLFSYLPRFYADVEIDNLDLNALTRKFSFGYIEGRLSGRISNLYLENWQPVTFYAWLGTPEGDNSTHKISQRAVKNIVSIGGGRAADLFSRGFLRFFEDFGYRQLGFGCYLYQGVCQLMGVEAVKEGYYIVKGGGLPRINVIGYNSRIDWNVLLRRLQRLSVTDRAVMQ